MIVYLRHGSNLAALEVVMFYACSGRILAFLLAIVLPLMQQPRQLPILSVQNIPRAQIMEPMQLSSKHATSYLIPIQRTRIEIILLIVGNEVH